MGHHTIVESFLDPEKLDFIFFSNLSFRARASIVVYLYKIFFLSLFLRSYIFLFFYFFKKPPCLSYLFLIPFTNFVALSLWILFLYNYLLQIYELICCSTCSWIFINRSYRELHRWIKFNLWYIGVKISMIKIIMICVVQEEIILRKNRIGRERRTKIPKFLNKPTNLYDFLRTF